VSEPDTLRICGAQVFDGSGAPAIHADVLLEGDRIAGVGGAGGGRELDASGLALAPGFIDVHSHDDFAALLHPDMQFKLRGGVTTSVVGNCGFGPAPFAEARRLTGALTPGLEPDPYEGVRGYFEQLEQTRPGTNIAVLAGHGTIRMAAMGAAEREPTRDELAAMKSILREAVDAGVLGISTGLIYEPGRYADAGEIAELAREFRGTGGLYATHMRDEGTGLLDSVREAIGIGAQAGIPVQISHLKASGRESWGLVTDALALIEAAQARGEEVHADQYPYTAGSTILRAVLQNRAFDPSGGPGAFSAVRPEEVVVASAPAHREWEGRSIAGAALSRCWHKSSRVRPARPPSGSSANRPVSPWWCT
jgi:N-acyl-D-aspartate/D-glutamate deacylase